MDRLKKILKSIPIPIFFIILVAIFILIANYLSAYTSDKVAEIRMELYDKYNVSYMATDNVYYITGFDVDELSKEDLRVYNIIEVISKYCYVFWYTLSISLCSFLFYFLKLRTPIKKLKYATKKIADNDLDFKVVPNSYDELGRLCESYEKMRQNLYENNIKMWRMIEDRKKLNSAFAHDIRTPLTILKGNTEMLLKYVPNKKITEEKMLELLEIMKNNIERLEEFLGTMNKICELEQIEPNYKLINAIDLFKELEENTKCLCEPRKIEVFFNVKTELQNFKADSNIIHEVYNNILNNAINYTENRIIINVLDDNNKIIFEIIDNGKGFSDKALKGATQAYFKDNKDKNHFGLGLYISKLLCEHHNGSIKISNTKKGAKVEFSFSYKNL